LNWSVIARVNGVSYNLFGVPSPDSNTSNANTISAQFTSTHSTFNLQAGNAYIALDFFSPVSVGNNLRQSLPFSYLNVVAKPVNGSVHPSVQIYSDIDNSWTGKTTVGSISAWNHTLDSAGTHIFQLRADPATEFSQNSANEMALWGITVWASRSSNTSKITAASGAAATVRNRFYTNGSLSNTYPDWASGSVIALSHDLGSVISETSVQFTIGKVRQRAISYLNTGRSHFYRATYSFAADAVSHFIDDYPAAVAEAAAFDNIINVNGTAIGGKNYSEILAISVRQIFGGIDLTIPSDTLDTNDVMAFIKEISSDGNVNTVDIIYPTFPFFHVFAPEYIRYLNDPVVRYLETGDYPELYVVHDIGFNYPVATGHAASNEEKMPVEETANMLIMMAAYQQRTGKTDWTSAHSAKLRQWADYLVANGEFPVNQLSTNDGLGAFTNMTSLSVKAAVGLAAYGQISGLANYTSTGKSFATTIYTTGIGVEVSPATGEKYFTLTYGNSTFFLLFNLYPDKLLKLGTFADAAFKGQSDLYPTVRQTAGVPLEGAVQWGKPDWQMWVAAIAESSVRTMFVNDLWAYVSNRRNTAPFGDRYWTGGTDAGLVAAGFRARPTLGAYWAFWALQV
jgi:hypothetical protein